MLQMLSPRIGARFGAAGHGEFSIIILMYVMERVG